MAKAATKTAKKTSGEPVALIVPKEIISYRLTNFDRDEIRSRALKSAFDPRKKLLDEAEDRLAREAYAIVFPSQVRKQAAALPKKWLRHDRCLRFNAEGMDVRLCVIGEAGLPVPYSSDCGRLGAIADALMVSAIRSHMDACQALKTERERASASLHAMLSNITTLRSLADAWPDGYPFFSYLNKPAPIRLPTLCVSELNAMLGLPQMQEAA